MKRPWQIWLLFGACVLAATAGMAWLTRQTLQADEHRRAAEAEAELDERVSLTLWRMDTELAPIIAEEVIRPPSAFRPSAAGPAVPPPYVLLQFEARPNGAWLSPPNGAWLSPQIEPKRLAELSASVDVAKLIADLPTAPLPSAADVGRNVLASNSTPPKQQNAGDEDLVEFFEGNTFSQPAQQQEPAQQSAPPQLAGKGTKLSQSADFEQRGKRYQSAAQQSLLNYGQQQAAANAPPISHPLQEKDSQKPPEELVGVSRPVWVGDRLLLARRVSGKHETFLQGSWLDWAHLKSRLLAEAADLLPKADLAPVNGDAAIDPSRMLAGLPVRLVVGETKVAGAVGTTLRWALGMGWGAVLLAVIAAAFLLQGVMTLSERRAAFVSSVTHELRTPLTTFRIYAEMLARGMVPDAARRQEYFDTLQRESERLTLLVENVLAYSRLERGRRPQAQDRLTLATLLDRVGPRLKQRAAQAGMECEMQLDENAANQEFTTDSAVVEQILFNLVDNAAKYARNAADRRIHVEARRNGKFVKLVVRDHGAGIDRRQRSRRVQPFSKSARIGRVRTRRRLGTRALPKIGPPTRWPA